jgi:hypothetical protein
MYQLPVLDYFAARFKARESSEDGGDDDGGDGDQRTKNQTNLLFSINKVRTTNTLRDNLLIFLCKYLAGLGDVGCLFGNADDGGGGCGCGCGGGGGGVEGW